MIKIVNTIEELFSSIEKDKISNSPTDKRYPIRLIFVNSFRIFNSIIKYLNKQTKLIELSSFLPHNDGWITPDKLIREMRKVNSTALIVPFSEVLRFTKPDIFNSILVSLFEIENSQDNLDNRIYIPMLGLWERFEKEFYEKFHRKSEWATIWRIQEQLEKQVIIYQINFPIKTNRTFLKTSSDWLNLWKCNKIDYLISRSKSLGYLYENFLPDTIFKMEELPDHKAFIESILEIRIPIQYSDKEIEYWKNISIELESKIKHDKYITFESYISKYFNIKSIFELNTIEILKIYLDNSTKYSRWLLKSWILSSFKYKKSYLYQIISDTNSFTNDEVIRIIWFNIFKDRNYSKDNFKERKEMITILHAQSSFSYSSIESELSVKLKNIK
ncbi:MAG: BREX-4 system phosphatase PglZ, partial [Candidatus Lokiarchaeota archaeon]|nr:BREX-4 system phosphatase PglZ [Candidatus Lokiarchaeota archaeon]